MAVFTLQSDIALATKITADTPSGGVTQGSFQSYNSINGFALVTAPQSLTTIGTAGTYESTNEQEYTLIVKADKVLALKVTGAITQGQKVYYDSGEAKVGTGATGSTACGWCVKDAASADTTVLIKFDGEIPVEGN